MRLQEKLKEHKTKFENKAKPEILEVMRRAKNDLRNSGILDRALKVGDKAPEFERENTVGEMIRLSVFPLRSNRRGRVRLGKLENLYWHRG